MRLEAPVKTNKKPLPFLVYYSGVFVLVLAGVIDSLYLLHSHYRNYVDMDYRSFCAISKAINCDTVSQSPYAIFLDLPVAFWGVMGYMLLLFLIGVSQYKKTQPADLWNLIFWLSLVYSFISVVLALVSTVYIHAWCIMCILSYGINFGVSFLSWIILRRFDTRGRISGWRSDTQLIRTQPWRFLPGFLIVICICLLAWIHLPRYWEMSPPTEIEHLKRGETAEGYPWIGADYPEITITEFSDYMCFQCKKMHFFLRQMVAQHPEKIRLIHRHFPMDRHYNPLVTDDYHSGAGKMAMIALYAQAKGQFWKVNDLLFDVASKKQDFNTRTFAAFMDVEKAEIVAALDHKPFRLRLKHDIAVGIDQGITGTPGFNIDGTVHLGTIPEGVLKKMISEND